MANLTISTIVNLNRRVGKRRSEKPVLDGEDCLIASLEPLVLAVAASAADLAEVSAIVPPPADADAVKASFSAVALGSDDSVDFSTSSSSTVIREIVNNLHLLMLLSDRCDVISGHKMFDRESCVAKEDELTEDGGANPEDVESSAAAIIILERCLFVIVVSAC